MPEINHVDAKSASAMAVVLEGGCRVSTMHEGTPQVFGSLKIWSQIGKASGADAISLRIARVWSRYVARSSQSRMLTKFSICWKICMERLYFIWLHGSH